MSKGKYSPNLPRNDRSFDYNAKRQIPPTFDKSEDYDQEIHFANYDSEGYDSYGYSAYDADGKFVGLGDGIDRNGYTEMDYLCMSDEEFEEHL